MTNKSEAHAHRKLPKLKITLKGREGRWWRRALYAALAVIAIIIAAAALKPERQLMSEPELLRVTDRGILFIGVRDDVPCFCEGGEGLEIDLAHMLASYILPDADDPVKLFTCSSMTVSTKISDGTVDIALALLPNGANKNYSYSYPYYTDTVKVLTLDPDVPSKALTEITIGYVQNTPAADVLSEYGDSLLDGKDVSAIDRLFGNAASTPSPDETLQTVRFGAYGDMLSALERGDIDAVVMQGAFVRRYSSQYRFINHPVSIGTVEYCMVASSDEPALMQAANMFLYELKQSGELDALLKKHGLSDN